MIMAISCKETKKAEEKEKTLTKEVPQDQLEVKVTQLEDSAQTAWNNMIQADDQKIAYTKRLLDEISYTPKYDVVKHAKLVEKTNNLKNKRFNENNFSSESIDKYDQATDSLLKEVKQLVITTPDIENYPLCNELINDITKLDNDVVMQRVKYDNWAMQYNNLITQHKEELKALGKNENELQEKSTFQLEN